MNEISLMTYADIIDEPLMLTRYANQSSRWICRFEYGETKTDSSSAILNSEYGSGRTPQEAIASYVDKIKDKILVLHAGGNSTIRKEYKVPSYLTA